MEGAEKSSYTERALNWALHPFWKPYDQNDSPLAQAAKIGYLIASPPIVAPAALYGHLLDEAHEGFHFPDIARMSAQLQKPGLIGQLSGPGSWFKQSSNSGAVQPPAFHPNIGFGGFSNASANFSTNFGAEQEEPPAFHPNIGFGGFSNASANFSTNFGAEQEEPPAFNPGTEIGGMSRASASFSTAEGGEE